jgi:hypothetical protein
MIVNADERHVRYPDLFNVKGDMKLSAPRGGKKLLLILKICSYPFHRRICKRLQSLANTRTTGGHEMYRLQSWQLSSTKVTNTFLSSRYP